MVNEKFLNECLKEVEEDYDTTNAVATLIVYSVIVISLAMFVIGIISIVKIGWLVGLFMIMFSIILFVLDTILSHIIKYVLKNHLLILSMYPHVRDCCSHVDSRDNFSRNEPCLCGSGKKYKKCCGQKL